MRSSCPDPASRLATLAVRGLARRSLPPAPRRRRRWCTAPSASTPTGCNAIVAALAATRRAFPTAWTRGYDGTQGTVDLAGGDLSGYAVFVVPSLADGPDVQPYGLLRDATIAARLQAAFMGRVAVWSGTPDVGSTNRARRTG